MNSEGVRVQTGNGAHASPVTQRPRAVRLGLVAVLLIAAAPVWSAGDGELDPTPPAPTEFTQRTGAANPLTDSGGDPIFLAEGTGAYLAPGDLDGDGDIDLVVGELIAGAVPYGTVSYYRNEGTATAPDFVKQSGVHALSGVRTVLADRSADSAYPVLADVDADGDLDLVVGGRIPPDGGEGAQNVLFFRNDGSPTSPTFTYVQEAENPFSALAARDASDNPVAPTIALGDVTDDGAGEAFTVGAVPDSLVYYYPNVGTPAAPGYGAPRTSEGDGNPVPFDAEGRHFQDGEVRLTAVDVDIDGMLDLIVGYDSGNGGRLRFLENTGSATSPAFTEQPDPNVFSETDSGVAALNTPHAALVDLDADGDRDLLVAGTGVGANQLLVSRVLYFENTTATTVVVNPYDATVSNRPGDGADVVSNKSLGTIYLVADGEPQGTQAELEAAVQNGLGASADVTAAREWVFVSTENLPGGTYHAYGVDPDGTVSTAARTSVVVEAPTAFAADSSNAWIQRVTIGPETNDSGNNEGYGRFDELTIELAMGETYQIEVEPGLTPDHPSFVQRLSWQRYGIWIDFNEDGDFTDQDETLLVAGPTKGTLSGEITIPTGTVPTDPVRLRVVMQFHELGEPTPAETVPYGEVEDYRITIPQP